MSKVTVTFEIVNVENMKVEYRFDRYQVSRMGSPGDYVQQVENAAEKMRLHVEKDEWERLRTACGAGGLRCQLRATLKEAPQGETSSPTIPSRIIESSRRDDLNVALDNVDRELNQPLAAAGDTLKQGSRVAKIQYWRTTIELLDKRVRELEATLKNADVISAARFAEISHLKETLAKVMASEKNAVKIRATLEQELKQAQEQLRKVTSGDARPVRRHSA